jgi:hypothetical protein
VRAWRTGLAVLWLALLALVAPVPELARVFDVLGDAGCCTAACCCAGGAPCAPTGPRLVSGCCCGHPAGAIAPVATEIALVQVAEAQLLPLIPRAPLALVPVRLVETSRPSPDPPPPRRVG